MSLLPKDDNAVSQTHTSSPASSSDEGAARWAPLSSIRLDCSGCEKKEIPIEEMRICIHHFENVHNNRQPGDIPLEEREAKVAKQAVCQTCVIEQHMGQECLSSSVLMPNVNIIYAGVRSEKLQAERRSKVESYTALKDFCNVKIVHANVIKQFDALLIEIGESKRSLEADDKIAKCEEYAKELDAIQENLTAAFKGALLRYEVLKENLPEAKAVPVKKPIKDTDEE